MSLETTVDCHVRFITRYDSEENRWPYFLNHQEIPVQLVTELKLPAQQPDC